MSVVYKLWEGGWPTMPSSLMSTRACSRDLTACGGSVMTDRTTSSTPFTFPSRRRSARPSCIRRGPRLRARLAARHAECVFMSGPSKKVIAPRVAAIRKLAAEAGRDPKAILMFAMMTVIVGADRRRGAGQARRLSPLC